MAANKTMIQNNVLDSQVPNKSILINQRFLFVLLVTGSNIMMCCLMITRCNLATSVFQVRRTEFKLTDTTFS